MSVRNRSFVLTGKMSRTRAAMTRAISDAGGSVVNSNRMNYANYVIVGKRPGADKLGAGERNGVPFITENEFWMMVREETYQPATMTRTEAVLYADTLDNNGRPIRQPAGVTPSTAVTAPPVTPAASEPIPVSNETERFSIADFFEED
jgi:BRCA1 C Terminus (BRCT) domain